MSGLHTLTRIGARTSRRVGRGQGSKRGKTSGRGTKGQNSRAGRKKRPEWRDIIKKLPKRRGFGKNRGRTVVSRPDAIVVTLERLEASFDAGSEITRATLREKGLVHARTMAPIKIVGSGTLSKKLRVMGCAVSAPARVIIEKAGGTIVDFVSMADAQSARIKTSTAATKAKAPKA